MKFEEKLVEDFLVAPALAKAEVTTAVEWNQPGDPVIDAPVIEQLEIAKDAGSTPARVLLEWVDDLLEEDEDEQHAAEEDKSLLAEFVPDSKIDAGASEYPPDIDDAWLFSSARKQVPVDDGDDGGGGGGGGSGDGDGDTPTDGADQPDGDPSKAKAAADKADTPKDRPADKAAKPKADKPAKADKPDKAKPAKADKPDKP